VSASFRPARQEDGAGRAAAVGEHPSLALEEMTGRLARRERPDILDVGPLCDQNIQHFLSQGCRVFIEAAEDLRRFPQRFPPRDEEQTAAEGEPPPPPRIVLSYPDRHFDAVLLWDVMDYLPEEIAGPVGQEVRRISRDGALAYLFSDSRKGAPPEPLLRFRIQEGRSVAAEPMAGPLLARCHREIRDLLRLFPSFEVVRSTLLRSQLREVLLKLRV